MKETWYTVSQAAELLQLHEKTLQRFIREKKLPATKVGRSYRISGHDLSVFTGEKDKPQFTSNHFKITSSDLKDHPAVSAVVDCYVGDRDQAIRISNSLNAVLNSKFPEDGPGRFDFVYEEEALEGKIVLYGSPLVVSKLLQIVNQLL